ncbi:MAG: flavoprotein [Pseudonocardiales bacterium]|nr:flavoprotein [Pseudonocardiales bacterium]
MSRGTIGLFGTGAGGVEGIRTAFVEPALDRDWQVAVTLSPCAARWLEHTGERAKLEHVTGLPVRDDPRMPGEQSPHPAVSCYVVAPATANTVGKLALGISDNQGLTTINEAIGGQAVPVIVFPRVNAAHTRRKQSDP